MKRRIEDDWIDRPTAKRDKILIVVVIIVVYLLLNMFIPSFKKFNMHAINYITFYTEFGIHVLDDKINNDQTEFEFKPLNIGHINFAVDEQISKIKSKTVSNYNANAVGDKISEQISGKTMKEAIDTISKGY